MGEASEPRARRVARGKGDVNAEEKGARGDSRLCYNMRAPGGIGGRRKAERNRRVARRPAE